MIDQTEREPIQFKDIVQTQGKKGKRLSVESYEILSVLSLDPTSLGQNDLQFIGPHHTRGRHRQTHSLLSSDLGPQLPEKEEANDFFALAFCDVYL